MVCAILPQHLVEGRAAGDPAAAPRRGTGHQRSFHRTLTGTDRRRSSRRSSSREGPPTILVFDGDRRCGARAWNLSVGAHVLAGGRGAGFDGDLRSGWRTRNPFGGERGFDGDGRCGARARNRSGGAYGFHGDRRCRARDRNRSNYAYIFDGDRRCEGRGPVTAPAARTSSKATGAAGRGPGTAPAARASLTATCPGSVGKKSKEEEGVLGTQLENKQR